MQNNAGAKGGEIMSKNAILIAVVVAVIFGAAGFFAGKYFQTTQRGNFAGRYGQRFGAGANAQVLRGSIISTDSGTMTVKLPDGSTKLVIVSGSTSITKATSGTTGDLKAGSPVMIFGASNSDGSVTAQNIQLNPGFGRPQPTQQ